MKKILSVFVVLGLAVAAADAAPSHLRRNSAGGYEVTYNYTDKAKTGWYITGRAELSLLNWKNEYTTTGVPADESADSDKYSFEPVFGGSLAGGFHFNYFWRAELELGYIGSFTDKDNGVEFTLSAPYAMANLYYDFVNGFYVGAGLGAALATTKVDAAGFVAGDRTERDISPMGGVMLGYSHKLDNNLVLDLRYRLAGFMGTEQTRVYIDELSKSHDFTNDIGLILDNSVSVGLRYEF